MTDRAGHVRQGPVSKQDTSAALVAAWARVCLKIGKGRFADKLGVDAKTVSRTLSGETVPELHTALGSLCADLTALDEVAALYDVEIRPRSSDAAMDFKTISDLSHLVGKWVEVMADGRRDHRETLQLADLLRPMMPHLTSILAEADRLKGIHP